MSQDGLSSTEDALVEMGDLMQLIYKARLNNESLKSIHILLPILLDLAVTARRGSYP